MILFSQKFQVSVPVEYSSKEYSASLNQLRDEFNNLTQEGSVMDYKVKFEELKALMLNSQPTLKESYFVLKFIDGLNDVLKPIVRMVCPAMIEQAAKRARLHEMTLEAISRKHRWQPNGYAKSNQQVGGIPKTIEA